MAPRMQRPACVARRVDRLACVARRVDRSACVARRVDRSAYVARRVDRSERGSGPITIWIGFVVFLTTLLFAVQALINLYATSVVTSVAYDAAREVAQSGGDRVAVEKAENRARRLLGRFGQRVTFDWSGSTRDDVVLRVRAEVPGVLLPPQRGALAFGSIDRTLRLRVERWQ